MGAVQWRQGWPVRALALATTAYSVTLTVTPKLMGKPLGLFDDSGSVPPVAAELTRSIGVRDAALALALAVSPVGYPMSVLTAARVVSDGSDALWLTRIAPTAQRGKVIGVAAGWATLELLVGIFGNRTRR